MFTDIRSFCNLENGFFCVQIKNTVLTREIVSFFSDGYWQYISVIFFSYNNDDAIVSSQKAGPKRVLYVNGMI